mgnify:CR=1 FL=1
MNLKEYLGKHPDVLSFKILDKNTLFYSTIVDSECDKNNESKFWGKLFDISYQKMEKLENSTNSTDVWKSSYDNSFIPKDEMDEWLNNSISRIKKLINEDSKVLEIGSGNGLIFDSIIDDVSKYTGTDVAEKGLNLIANSKKGKLNANKINLYQLDALNIDEIPKHKYDLIIVNSVAQYFPSLDYIFNVVKKLEQYASQNCNIYLGDIRSYELQKLFYYDILNKKQPKISNEDLKTKITNLEKRENETLYNSNLFTLFTKVFNYINSCCVELKDGKFNNELNLYRYDVTLFCNYKKEGSSAINSFNWEEFKNPKEDIIEKLKILQNNEVLEIANIPNSRFNKVKDGYKSLYNMENIQTSLKAHSLSFFKELAIKENVFIQSNFSKEDVLMFNVQFCKMKLFSIKEVNDQVKYENLSNKFNEKTNKEDRELELKIRTEFPNVIISKVSNYLLSK